jgi:predicted nicotinamide N-methyase
VPAAADPNARASAVKHSDGMTTERPVPAEFVRRYTRPQHPPLVPEVTLLVADDVVALWEAMEAERGAPAEEPPFWSAAWPGGQALGRYLLDHPEVVAGRTVLDLGSGSGLVAVAALLAGAARAVASEIDPFGVTAIALNAAGNGVRGIEVVGDVLDATPSGDVDVVLAGDVCYAREMAGRVLPFLDAARRAGAEVLLGDPGRAYLPSDRLTRVAGYDVPDVDGGTPRRAAVWRLP